MAGKKRNSNFLVQSSILAVASIISRIIGMIYRIPLTNIIGKEGNAFYGAAFEIYSLALLLSSFGLPLAVSKLVAARLGKGEKRNAYQVFKIGMIFALVVGVVSFLVVFFGADFFTDKIMNSAPSALAVKVLAPALLVVAIMGVIRGYFQGIGTMIPTAISQLIEQIINAIVSVVAAYQLFQVGQTLGEKSGNADTAAAYGAAGGTMGSSVGAVAGLLFLLIVFLGYKRVLSRQLKRDRSRKKEASADIFKSLLWTIVPVALSTVIYNINSLLDQGIFNSVQKGLGMSPTDYNYLWGIFSGEYKVLTNVPVAIASAVVSSIVPGLTMAISQKKYKTAVDKIDMAVRFTMIITIPCAVGMSVLADPINRFLYTDASEISTLMLQTGSACVVFFGLSTLTNGILQGINKMKLPVINAGISLIIHIASLYVMLYVFKWHIYGQMIAYVLFGLIMCVLNWISIAKNIAYRQEIKRTFVIPIAASAIMGVVAYFVHLGLERLIGNKISLIVAIVLAVVAYGITLLVLKEFEREELLGLPKGRLIVRIAEKLRLM